VEGGLERLGEMEGRFPDNAFCTTQRAISLALADHGPQQALRAFERLRAMEPLQTRGMDVYGYLLFSTPGSDSALSLLALQLMETNKGSPQTWAVAALYSERRGDSDKAAAFIEHAIRLDPQHAFLYRVRGLVQLSAGALSHAVISFRQANSIKREVDNYAGIVRALLDLGQLKDARQAAAEAVDLAPKSSLAHMLHGKVLEKSQKSTDSLRAYGKSLALNPGNIACVLSKTEVLLALENRDAAIACLKSALETSDSPSLRLMLGKVYAADRSYSDAVEQLQLCHLAEGASAAERTEAQAELDRTESLLSSAEGADDQLEGSYDSGSADLMS
jgi:tetratricopeptide (TPR) repeat protein